jgi:hypothetical protein
MTFSSKDSFGRDIRMLAGMACMYCDPLARSAHDRYRSDVLSSREMQNISGNRNTRDAGGRGRHTRRMAASMARQ